MNDQMSRAVLGVSPDDQHDLELVTVTITDWLYQLAQYRSQLFLFDVREYFENSFKLSPVESDTAAAIPTSSVIGELCIGGSSDLEIKMQELGCIAERGCYVAHVSWTGGPLDGHRDEMTRCWPFTKRSFAFVYLSSSFRHGGQGKEERRDKRAVSTDGREESGGEYRGNANRTTGRPVARSLLPYHALVNPWLQTVRIGGYLAGIGS